MISQRTFIIALLLVCVIDMIPAGVVDDIAKAAEDAKDFAKDTADKTGEAVGDAYDNVKDSVSRMADDSANPSHSSATKF